MIPDPRQAVEAHLSRLLGRPLSEEEKQRATETVRNLEALQALTKYIVARVQAAREVLAMMDSHVRQVAEAEGDSPTGAYLAGAHRSSIAHVAKALDEACKLLGGETLRPASAAFVSTTKH